MMTFVVAVAVLAGALCVTTALDGATAEAPPGVVASQVLAAALLATDRTAPVALSDRRRGPSKAGRTRVVTVREADPAAHLLASG
jgi:hypothetical protein